MVPWFEFSLPWNVLLEPEPLVALELVCWAGVLVLVGLTIAGVEAALGRNRVAARDGPFNPNAAARRVREAEFDKYPPESSLVAIGRRCRVDDGRAGRPAPGGAVGHAHRLRERMRLREHPRRRHRRLARRHHQRGGGHVRWRSPHPQI